MVGGFYGFFCCRPKRFFVNFFPAVIAIFSQFS